MSTHRERDLAITEELIRAYSRRGNYHSEASTSDSLGLPGLVAQGLQVADFAAGDFDVAARIRGEALIEVPARNIPLTAGIGFSVTADFTACDVDNRAGESVQRVPGSVALNLAT